MSVLLKRELQRNDRIKKTEYKVKLSKSKKREVKIRNICLNIRNLTVSNKNIFVKLCCSLKCEFHFIRTRIYTFNLSIILTMPFLSLLTRKNVLIFNVFVTTLSVYLPLIKGKFLEHVWRDGLSLTARRIPKRHTVLQKLFSSHQDWPVICAKRNIKLQRSPSYSKSFRRLSLRLGTSKLPLSLSGFPLRFDLAIV